jgi:hypothetical protein
VNAHDGGLHMETWPVRPGGDPPSPPSGSREHQVPPDGMREALAGAPRQLRTWCALAEAAGRGWPFTVQRAGRPGAPADTWAFAILTPDGTMQRYTWVRKGGVMDLVAQYAAAPAGT